MVTPPSNIKNVQLWEKRCRQLKAYADRVAAGEIDIFEGSIRILTFQTWLQVHNDQDFAVFRKVSDRAIGLPVGQERAHWSPGSLARKDVLIEKLRSKFRSPVVQAASKIGDKYWCPKKRPTSKRQSQA